MPKRKLDQDQVEQAILEDQSIPENVDFCVTFVDSSPLTSMIAILDVILDNCPLTVVAEGESCDEEEKNATQSLGFTSAETFQGIYIKCIDSSHTCVIIAKLYAKVYVAENVQLEDCRIMVSAKLLLAHLKNVNSTSSVQLYQHKDESKLFIKTRNLSSSHYRIATIKAVDYNDEELTGISDMKFMYTLEFNLRTLQGILKMARIIDSNALRFRILKNDSKHYIVIQIAGNMTDEEHVFESNTQLIESSQTLVIQGAALNSYSSDLSGISQQTLESKFDAKFLVNQLDCFLKNVEHQNITIRVSQDDALTSPLVISSRFGDEQSFVAGILADKTDDDKDMMTDRINSFAP